VRYGQPVGQDAHQQDATLISAAVIWKTFNNSSSSITVIEGRSYRVAVCWSI
jgi:hypothetical protein